jgi:tRNA(fMet)-specific endonuclease VapC
MDYLLDTNIVSLAIRRDFKVTQQLQKLKLQKKKLAISCVTYFEVRRGLLAIESPKQSQRFYEMCQAYPIIFLDDLAILEKAADIHANLRLRGLPIQTEDILIAATAIIKGLTVVSNDSDFLRIEGLKLENWKRPL